MLGMSVADRITYDPHRNILFSNLEGMKIRTIEDVEIIRREFEKRCRAIGKRVRLIANYDRFELHPSVEDAYFSTISYLQQRFYQTASRYTTSAFLRLKMGDALTERELAPHVFETKNEASEFSEDQGKGRGSLWLACAFNPGTRGPACGARVTWARRRPDHAAQSRAPTATGWS